MREGSSERQQTPAQAACYGLCMTWRRVFMLLVLGMLIGLVVAFRH